MKNLVAVFAFLLAFQGIGQMITHGPLVGGVTPTSARIYFGLDTADSFTVELDTDSLFPAPISFSANADTTTFYVEMLDVTGLQAETKYYYRADIGGAMSGVLGSFKTFPQEDQEGYYKVVVGSCNYHDHYSGGGATSPDTYYNDVLFQSIVDFDPSVVLHLGDWNYPPSAFGANYNLDSNLVNQSFRLRYEDYNFSTHLMPNLPIDYIYDDDYSQNGAAGWTYPTVTFVPGGGPLGADIYELDDPALPVGIREGAIEGYFKNFPGYEQEGDGIYHSFKLGNVEFFVVDTRTSKDPVHEVFEYNSILGTYSFNPPAGHTTLGLAQRQWLLDGLTNSDADWKVICSGVVFNQAFGGLMDLIMPVQIIDRQIIELAASIAYMWPGYPEDVDALMTTIEDEDIKNVVMLSGDTHSSMMDDGANSGIPELSASGWAAGNESYLNYMIDSVANQFSLGFTSVKDFLWNGGGSGIDNQNFSDTYGTMEFFYTDSLRMCVIDEFDQTLACQTLMFEEDNSSSVHQYVPSNDVVVLYPNPAKTSLRLLMDSSAEEVKVVVVSAAGEQVLNKTYKGNDIIVDIESLPQGAYVLNITSNGQTSQRKFVKH